MTCNFMSVDGNCFPFDASLGKKKTNVFPSESLVLKLPIKTLLINPQIQFQFTKIFFHVLFTLKCHFGFVMK
jgi:hypothetical protein